jgi:hypothetical protein
VIITSSHSGLEHVAFFAYSEIVLCPVVKLIARIILQTRYADPSELDFTSQRFFVAFDIPLSEAERSHPARPAPTNERH